MENSLSKITAGSPIRYTPPPRLESGWRQDGISLSEIWAILRKRKWVIASCLGVALACAGVYCVRAPRRYEAKTRVVINPGNENPLGLAMDTMNPFADRTLMQETQVRIMESDSVAWDVIRQLRLDQKREFAPSARPESIEPISPARRFELLERFHRRLNVASVPKTALVELRFRSQDPKLAADIVNAIANAYLERNFRTRYDASMQASEWLSRQLDDLKKRVECSQQQLVDFQKKNGIINTDETHNIVISQLEELNKQLAAAQAERIVREARYREALSDDPEVIADIAPTATLQVLRGQQADLRDQYAQASAKYGSAYPRVEQLRTQISQVESSLQKEVKNARRRLEAEYQASSTAEKMALSEVEKSKQQAYRVNEAGVEYLVLKRDAEASRDLYEDLQKKLKEAGIIAGLKTTNVNVVDPAEVPARPVEPRVALNLLVAFLLGSMGGLALTFLLENLDTTINSPEHAEALASMPMLCVVPHLRLQGRNGQRPLEESEWKKPWALVRPQSSFAESFRALRTTLLLSAPGSAPKVLAVTSAMPGEGKTLTAINTAVTLAQNRRRVLLVDADMRRSDMKARLGIQSSEGLSSCLTGASVSAGAVISLPELPTLQVLLAGQRPPSPGELLESDQMRVLLEEWRTAYDHVVLDTPPVLGLTDAVVLAALSDAVLLVVRCSRTGRQSLCRARDMLARVNARTVGMVLNDLNLNSSEHYGYYGYYGDAYSAYYGDKDREN